MAADKLQKARQLIQDKHYEEARFILKQLKNDATAQKWLAKLDEITPQNETSVNTTRGVNNFPSVIVFGLLLLITFALAIYGAFFRSAGSAQAQPDIQAIVSSQIQDVSSRIDNVEGSVTQLSNNMSQLAQTGQGTKWEYLILSYSQVSSFDGNDNPYETVFVDQIAYMEQFDNGCDVFDIDCQQRNFKGMSYYIAILGQDSWELTGINGINTNYYQVELFFKRPLA